MFGILIAHLYEKCFSYSINLMLLRFLGLLLNWQMLSVMHSSRPDSLSAACGLPTSSSTTTPLLTITGLPGTITASDQSEGKRLKSLIDSGIKEVLAKILHQPFSSHVHRLHIVY